MVAENIREAGSMVSRINNVHVDQFDHQTNDKARVAATATAQTRTSNLVRESDALLARRVVEFAKGELGKDTELEPGTTVETVELTAVLIAPEVEVEFAREELTSIPVPQGIFEPSPG